MLNPFTPGFNRLPLVFPGRDGILAEVKRRIDYCGHTSFQPPLMLIGSRGMGKTVLLTSISQYVQKLGWKILSPTSTNINVLDDLRSQLQSKPHFKNTGMEIGLNAIVRASISSNLEQSQTSFLELLEQQFHAHPGVLIIIDEIHEFQKSQLEGFATILQKIAPTHIPLYVACAGLPTMRSPENRITYFERNNWVNIGILDSISALAVLRETSKQGGKPIPIPLCEELTHWCGNYPFALQTLGEYIWEAAESAPTINHEHIEEGKRQAAQKLYEGFFSYRWHYYSSERQHYLYNLAQLQQELDSEWIKNAQIANRLRLATSQLSKVRLSLVQDGILQENEEKAMRFLLPIIQEWILREMQ